MALNIDPERERKLMAVNEAQRAWAEKYGIDDVDFNEEGGGGRRPTAEQAMELERTIREISGQDPDTGLYRR